LKPVEEIVRFLATYDLCRSYQGAARTTHGATPLSQPRRWMTK